ncbi:hypothetical protein EOD40_04060 [Flavobacterium sufflavum]|uniref:Uncharacterized protein n=1 Tax=Flavobacterium sufflavum TaxID=1921138 RepID=A0A3S2U801_9FLAO|nr:hypothetical protein [Flavobacterium sufflavum]RVT78418.1 hypothetical protein EOD40_04060 [Flavobacterium sufflavum]
MASLPADFPENEFISKNKTLVIYALSIITFFISLGFLDFYVLPTLKTTDIITHYAIRTVGGKNGTKPQKLSYHYYTQKGFTFSTVKNYIEESDIELEYSLVFKSVTKIKSKNNDYTSDISSSLSINGIQFYFYCVLLFSIAISLKILLSGKRFSENTFYNIICFNGFMVFLCLYMFYLY